MDGNGDLLQSTHIVQFLVAGVSQIAVAINKMDTVGWDQSRYKEIVKKLGQFLKQVGFKEADLSFVPCSGLNGENLTRRSDPVLKSWYSGPTLTQQIGKVHRMTVCMFMLSLCSPPPSDDPRQPLMWLLMSETE